MTTKRITIGDAISFGWRTFTGNAGIWVGIVIALFLIEAVISGIFRGIFGYGIIYQLVTMLVNAAVSLSLLKIALDFIDNKPFDVNEVTPILSKHFLNYFISSIIFGIIVTIGFILLIIPGIILAVRLQFFGYFMVDKDADITGALQKSWDETRGYTGSLFLFGLALIGIIILGAIALGIGLLVAVPVVILATAYMYREISGPAEEESGYTVQAPEPVAPAPAPEQEVAPMPAPEPAAEPAPEIAPEQAADDTAEKKPEQEA